MKKKLLVIAVGAAMAAPAMADVTIYGRAHVSADYQDTKNNYHGTSISSNASRIGFKAEDDFGGITAFMQLEQTFDATSGGDSQFNTRDTFVGLKNQVGMVRIGRFNSPFKAARGPANLFNNQLGDMRSIMAEDGFDNRMDNTIHVQTPDFGGFQFNVGYSIHEDEYNSRGISGSNDNSQSFSTSVTFDEGPFDLAAAYERYEKDAGGRRDAIRLAGGFDLADDLKAVAFYQYNDSNVFNAASKYSNIYGVGGQLDIVDTGLKLMYMGRDGQSSKQHADMIVMGVEQRLAPALRVYANYALAFNKDEADVTPWAAGGRNVGGVAREDENGFATDLSGKDSQGLSAGLIYNF